MGASYMGETFYSLGDTTEQFISEQEYEEYGASAINRLVVSAERNK